MSGTYSVDGITWNYSTQDGVVTIGNITNQTAMATTLGHSLGGDVIIPSTIPASVTGTGDLTVTSIGVDAFRGTAITSVTIPNSITHIGTRAFLQSSQLVSVTFGNSVVNIEAAAFYITDLGSITIPDSVETIGASAFGSNLNLTSVTLGTSVVSLGSSAFISCTSLTSINIPSSLVNIGNSCFVSTPRDGLVVTMNTQTFEGAEYVSPGTYDHFFGARGVTLIEPPPPPPATCFPAGTPIQTDQGVTAIEQLVPGEHTLRGKSILAITQTRPLQKHIVCFEKDSIGKNVPSQQTICSKEHKVLYQGEMIKARDLADMCKNVKKVSYNGETLYNVLLEKHGKILVNNMICETLHPENIAAKFAKFKNSPSKRVVV
jgi:hypothetical protein